MSLIMSRAYESAFAQLPSSGPTLEPFAVFSLPKDTCKRQFNRTISTLARFRAENEFVGEVVVHGGEEIRWKKSVQIPMYSNTIDISACYWVGEYLKAWFRGVLFYSNCTLSATELIMRRLSSLIIIFRLSSSALCSAGPRSPLMKVLIASGIISIACHR